MIDSGILDFRPRSFGPREGMVRRDIRFDQRPNAGELNPIESSRWDRSVIRAVTSQKFRNGPMKHGRFRSQSGAATEAGLLGVTKGAKLRPWP